MAPNTRHSKLLKLVDLNWKVLSKEVAKRNLNYLYLDLNFFILTHTLTSTPPFRKKIWFRYCSI